MSIRNIFLVAAILSFTVIAGAGVYEHVTMVPRWKFAPPLSLSMFQGEYGIDNGRFWKMIHPVTLLLLIAALVLNWKTARRKFMLISIIGYLLVLGITAAYFVPELLSIIQTAYKPVADPALAARAATWEKLSLVRLVVCFAIAAGLMTSLTKGNHEVLPTAPRHL